MSECTMLISLSVQNVSVYVSLRVCVSVCLCVCVSVCLCVCVSVCLCVPTRLHLTLYTCG
jgi:hypothetical protein